MTERESNLFNMGLNLGLQSGAIFSPCERYRYHLWRVWNDELPILVWIMLNPSTADAEKDDPTIRRCIGFAKRDGYGGVSIRNVFAYRATDPRELEKVADPFGPENGMALLNCRQVSLLTRLVVAWGVPIVKLRRSNAYKDAANAAAINEAYCLGTTKSGDPRHPLYVRGDAELITWKPKS